MTVQPKGLFAHIQSNLFRSIALFVWFAVILQLLQIFLLGLLAWMGQSPEAAIAELTAIFNGEGQKTFRSVTDRAEGKKDLAIVWSEVKRHVLAGHTLYLYVPAALHIIIGMYMNGFLVRRQTKARRVERHEAPRLFALIEPLAISRGLPVPQVEVMESEGMNAYTSGFSPRSSVIGVSMGLVKGLSDAELQAVLAHEIAHIENRDNRLLALTHLCVMASAPNLHGWVREAKRSPWRVGVLAAFVLAVTPWHIVLLIYGTLFALYGSAFGVQYAICRKRDYVADARALEMVKQPAALITALYKVAQNDRIEGLNPAVQSLLFSNQAPLSGLTHPSIANRIQAINATTGTSFQGAMAARMAPDRQHWAGQIASTQSGMALLKPGPIPGQPTGVQGFGQRRDPGAMITEEESRSEKFIDAYDKFQDGSEIFQRVLSKMIILLPIGLIAYAMFSWFAIIPVAAAAYYFYQQAVTA